MCVSVLYVCMLVYHEHTYRSGRLGECVRSPGTGVKDSCKPPLGCQPSKPSPREDQPVLLTAELSLATSVYVLKQCVILPLCLSVWHNTLNFSLSGNVFMTIGQESSSVFLLCLVFKGEIFIFIRKGENNASC